MDNITGRRELISHWTELVDSAVSLRRKLHQNPELTWEEKETALTIRTLLTDSGIAWRPCATHGAIATIAPEAKGRHIALRADMDALPITEATETPWASRKNGLMHACGHDGHTAAMMAVAQWFKLNEDKLPGPVSIFFQPAEEGGHGARKMIEEGALKGVDAIYGWHNWPAIRAGKAVCPDGTVMAANGTFGIKVIGKGGHASQPEACRDPVLAASAITMALQQAVSRRLPPQQASVISVTSINAPSTDTITPQTATLGGSFRIADNALRPTVHRLITDIARDTARAYGVEAEVEMRPRYLATVNHPAEAENFRSALSGVLGEEWRSDHTPLPVMASEDFSYYLNEIPGAFALIGADDGDGHDIPCHSPHYDFNDDLIPIAVRIFSRLAGAPLPE